MSDTTVYVGGAFSNVGGKSRNNIGAIDIFTGQVTGWNPNSNGHLYALAESGNTIYAGGIFSSIGGRTRNGLAAIDAISGTATSWNPRPTSTRSSRYFCPAQRSTSEGGSTVSAVSPGPSWFRSR